MSSASGLTPSKPDVMNEQHLKKTYGKLPLSFEANQGQTAPGVQFLSRGKGYTSFLSATSALTVFNKITSQGASIRMRGRTLLKRPTEQKATINPIKMTLLNSNPAARAIGMEELPSKINYLIGNNPANWHTEVPTFSKVKYEGIYPGIDLIYYGNEGQLEQDFIVAPGGDVSSINFNFNGTRGLRINPAGELILKIRGGELRQSMPIVYQEVDGGRREISSRYALTGKGRVGFEVGDYDHGRPLVIDPVLTYSTYLGGSIGDTGNDIAVDSSGNVFIVGSTTSTNFPVVSPVQPTNAGSNDVFVARLNPTGTALLYSTYLGGSAEENPSSIALDSSGNAYITGVTGSTDFPTVSPLQPNKAGEQDVFVAKLNSTGTALLYSTYLGGNKINDDTIDFEFGCSIVVDSSGSAYVAGTTNSPTFPTLNAYRPVITSGSTCHLTPEGYLPCDDGFVTKINPTGTALVYSTYLGGDEADSPDDITVDSSGNAYVTGVTYSTNFPTTANALQSVKSGISDAFVTKLSPTGTELVFSTCLGGSGDDEGVSIKVDASNSVYVAGVTTSTDLPTVNPFMSIPGGSQDAFVSKLNSTGSALIYSTYLGGNNQESVGFIDVSDCGNAHIVGITYSTNFPVTAGAVMSGSGGGADVFVAKLNRSGNALAYSSYLGGSQYDWGRSLVLDSSENTYIAGETGSLNFPVTAGAYRTSSLGIPDAFVAKLALKDYPGDPTKPAAPDATSGTPPYTAASAEYHPGADSNNYHPSATPDPTVLPDRPTEIWAKYYWPQGLSAGPYPVAIFLHGNHYSCGRTWTQFITNVTPGTVKNNSSSWLGMKITTGSQPVIVRYLGRMFLSGNTGTHGVKIVRASDNATIVSVSVPMAGGTVNQFKYVQLASPVTLAANTSYYIASQEANHGDSWYDSNTIVSSTSVATVNGRVSSNNGNSWSTTGAVPGQVYGPVDFLYDGPARTDDNWQYTIAGTYGTCPSGYVVAPSHRGYDYLANQLASWGYVVVSINTNLGMSFGATPYYQANNPSYPEYPDDPGLNLARGRLVLKYLQQLSEWNRGVTPTPASLGVDFTGKIDLSNVGLMGHSRGGEGVRAAYNIYRDPGSPWPARIVTPVTVKGIFEIAPTDGQTSRILNVDGVAWNVLLPACDGDVNKLQGVRPFDRAITLHSENPAAQKSTFMVWGANHNFYNTQWQRSEWPNDSTACIGTGNTPLFLNPTVTGSGYGSAQQQQTALASVIPFFRGNVGSNASPNFNQNFDPRYSLPALVTSVTQVQRAFTPSPKSTITTIFEDFDQATGTNSSGVANDDYVSITHVTATDCTGCLTVPDHFYDFYDPMPIPPVSQLFKAGAISWTSTDGNPYFQTNWTNLNNSADISGFQSLDFLVGRQRSSTAPTLPNTLNTTAVTNFSIQLVMADNSLSEPVCLSTYADLNGPVGGANELHTILQTVRIPLTDFNGNQLNLSQVRGIRFTFNKTTTGAIYLANIRLARP
jgi:hypothetical protein